MATPTTSYDRSIPAKLVVQLDNGESWDATTEDLERFGLLTRHEAYMGFNRALDKTLRDAKLLDDNHDLTYAALNPIRYFVELAVVHPEMLDAVGHGDTSGDVAEIERVLRRHAAGA